MLIQWKIFCNRGRNSVIHCICTIAMEAHVAIKEEESNNTKSSLGCSIPEQSHLSLFRKETEEIEDAAIGMLLTNTYS